MATKQVTIDTDTQEVYKKEEVELLLSKLEEYSKNLDEVREENRALKTERRLLYQDVKKIYQVLPMEGGAINYVKLPRIINELTKNPENLKAFDGLQKFINNFEKNNLTVINTSIKKP